VGQSPVRDLDCGRFANLLPSAQPFAQQMSKRATATSSESNSSWCSEDTQQALRDSERELRRQRRKCVALRKTIKEAAASSHQQRSTYKLKR